MSCGPWLRALRRVWRVPLLIAHLALGCLIAACLPRGAGRVPSSAPMVWWSRVLCRLLGVRVRVYGAPLGGRALFVANHVSWLDIMVIAAVCPTHFLAKAEVGAWPLFGWLCRCVGTAFIRRGETGGAQAAASELVWRLQRRDGRVLVFPEGTSTDGCSVRRFYPRLFQAAEYARCPVQALAVRYPLADGTGTHPAVPFVGDDELLSHLWRLLGERGPVAEVHCLPPLAGETGRDALARQTHAQIAAVLAAGGGGTAASRCVAG